MGKKREYDDDDGRTIADMSGLYMGGTPAKPDKEQGEEYSLSKSERRYYILGALKAGLLIAFAFIAGLGLVVGLLLLLWS